MAAPCQEINTALSELFSCQPVGEYTRIRTPFLYPDGDVIDLFVLEKDGSITITDLGESLRWLQMQTISPKRTAKQKQLLEDICLNHGVELFRGMLLLRLKAGDSYAATVTRLAQAALRVGDLWFTARTRAVQTITDEIAEFLLDRNVAFDRNQKLPGRSGRIWPIDFHTRQPKRSALVNVLATGSRAAAKGIAAHTVAAWHDLSHLRLGPEALTFVSLFDDTADVWTTEDFNLVESVSTIARWSRADEFAELLAAA